MRSLGIRPVLAALLLALTACGSDDDGEAAPVTVTVTAGADAADLTWNAVSEVDVLANDTASAGTLTLTAVTTPAHGTAVVADGKVRYTPAAGYFGPDALSYTVTGEGSATATAELALTVSAALTVSGTVSDILPAGAALVANIGSRSMTTNAGDDGHYQLSIRTDDPAESVLLTASGVGAQRTVKLASLLGDTAALAALAGARETLDAGQLPALGVSALSTAVLALVTESNGGTTPATRAAFDALALSVSLERALDLATAIVLVADNGAALPEGVADTLALVDAPSTSQVLAEFLDAAQSGDAIELFAGARVDLQNGVATGGVPAVARDGSQTLLYFLGYKASSVDALHVTLEAGGRAQVVGSDAASDAAWTAADGEITLVLTEPFSYETFSLDPDPITGWNDTLRVATRVIRIRPVSGSAGSGAVLVIEEGDTTTVDGREPGKIVPFTDPGYPRKVLDITAVPSDALSLSTSDFPAGTLLAGVGDDLTPGASGADILSFADASRASYVRQGVQKTWSIEGGALKLVGASGEQRYRPLAAALANGQQHWLVSRHASDGTLAAVAVELLAAVTPGLKFETANSSYRRWQSGISDDFFFDVYADGTGREVSLDPAGDSVLPTTWSIDAAGRLTHFRPNFDGTIRRREWLPVRRQGGSVIVLEDRNPFPDLHDWRMNIYADTGPAVEGPAVSAAPTAHGSRLDRQRRPAVLH